MSTIRATIAIAAAKGQVVLQGDFPNAYINADIQDEVYVIQPKGLEDPNKPHHVCSLKEALYGCPVSGKRWNTKLSEVILSLGYQRSAIDHSLFIRKLEDRSDILVLYVDDVLVTFTGGRRKVELELEELNKTFEIKVLGKATHILGMGVHQDSDQTYLEQRSYLENILNEADFLQAKPRNTPWDSHQVGGNEQLDATMSAVYRRTLGQLMYLATMTRPDILFAVNRLATVMKEPKKGDWDRVKRVLRYLSGTKNVRIRYINGEAKPRIDVYVDTSFAVDPKRGRSITGYAILLTGGPVSWRSHLQPTVADSPNAAEYIGLYEAAVAATGMSNLIKEIGVDCDTPVLHEDNDGARRLATDGMGQKKGKASGDKIPPCAGIMQRKKDFHKSSVNKRTACRSSD